MPFYEEDGTHPSYHPIVQLQQATDPPHHDYKARSETTQSSGTRNLSTGLFTTGAAFQ